MARRSKDWNEGLAKDLRDLAFAQKFIVSALEDENLPLQVVLGKVIRAYGVKEFAKLIKMPSSNLIRALGPKANPTQDTVNRLLRPFNLGITVVPLKVGKKAA